MRSRRAATLISLLLFADPSHAVDIAASTPAMIIPPSLNTNSIGDILVAGSFDGISQLLYEDQTSLLIPPVNYADDLFSRSEFNGNEIFLKQSFSNGLIRHSCSIDDSNYVLAGNFTSIFNQTNLNGLAFVNFTSGSVVKIASNLTNLNGSNVNVLHCNNTNVYLGGSFSLNNSYGVAVWDQKTNQISVPPFGGFSSGAKINAIVPLNDSLVFGGRFDGLLFGGSNNTNRSTSPVIQPGMQPVSLTLANATAYGSLNATGVDASNILCPGSGNSGWTADLDSSTGYIDVTLAYTAFPTRVRLFNLADGSGTKFFRIISTPVGSFMNLTYTDSNGRVQNCAAFCPLPESENAITYTDFDFVNVVPTYGFRIELLDFYGTHPGLNGIMLFEQGQHAFAYNPLNSPRKCPDNSEGTLPSSMTPSTANLVGNGWSVVGDYMTVNINDRSTLQSTYAQLNPTFGYYAVDKGIYEIMLYTPGCANSGTCSMRGSVDVSVYPGFGTPITTTLFQTNQEFKYDVIYNGTLQTGAYIRITPSQQNKLPMEFVAYDATLNYLGALPGYNATNLFQYSPANFSDSTAPIPVGNTSINVFGTKLGNSSEVKALMVDESSNKLIVGGTNFPVTSNKTLFSLEINDSGDIQANGISGIDEVTDLRNVNGTLFTFSNKGAYILNNQGDSLQSTVVNETVNNITPFNFNGSSYYAFSNTPKGIVYLWDSSANEFANASIQNRLTGHVSGSYKVANSTLYTGSLTIVGAAAPGGAAVIGNSNETSSKKSGPPYTFTQRSHKSKLNSRATIFSGTQNTINGGCYINPSDILVVGQFDALLSDNSSVKNALIVRGSDSYEFMSSSISDFIDNDNTIFYVANQFEGVVAVGGEFSGKLNSSQVSNFIIYNANTSSFFPNQPAQLASDRNGNSVVNSVTFRPNSSEIIVGGQFSGTSSTVSNGTCNGLCSYSRDLGKWKGVSTELSLAAGSNVTSVLFETGSKMIIAGSFALENNNKHTIQVATYDLKNSSSFTELPDLPSPPVDMVVITNNTDRQGYVATGQDGESVYVKFYDSDSNSWTDIPNNPFDKGSTVTSLSTLSLKSFSTLSNSSWPFVQGRALIVSGQLVVNNVTGVSMVAFNGTHWVPMYGTSGSSSVGGQVNAVFSQFGGGLKGSTVFGKLPKFPHLTRRMPVGHVVGIACGIGIGCVIVLSALYLLVELLFNLGQRDPTYQLLAQPTKQPESPIKKRPM